MNIKGIFGSLQSLCRLTMSWLLVPPVLGKSTGKENRLSSPYVGSGVLLPCEKRIAAIKFPYRMQKMTMVSSILRYCNTFCCNLYSVAPKSQSISSVAACMLGGSAAIDAAHECLLLLVLC